MTAGEEILILSPRDDSETFVPNQQRSSLKSRDETGIKNSLFRPTNSDIDILEGAGEKATKMISPFSEPFDSPA